MQLEDVKAAVEKSLNEKFDTLFAAYQQERPEGDLAQFLLHLVEQNLLSDDAMQIIAEALPILESNGTLAGAPKASDEAPARPEQEADEADAAEDEAGDEAEGAERPKHRESGTDARQRRRTRDTAASDQEGERPKRRSPDDTTGARRVRKRGAAAAAEGKTGRGYDFIGFVGEGAMGKVRLAKDLDLQRVVAYKEMSEEIMRNKILAGKFYAEAQITAQLDHPNIVPIYALTLTEAGALAYSMKLINGKTWEKLVEESWEFYDKKSKKKRPDAEHSLATRLDQFLKCCDAVHYAHMRGVIHRDLKPENIMVGPYGEVYVMDWGIAKVIEPPKGKTPTAWVDLEDTQPKEGEIIIGTPQYMSPEQADGVTDGLTPASDQYALGLILFELVSLQQAVTGKTPMAIVTRQQEGEKNPLNHYGGEKIPTELRAIVEKATRPEIGQRYASVADLAEDIRRYLRGEAVLAKPDTIWQRLLRWMQNHREITLLGIVSMVLLFTFVTVLSQGWYQYRTYQQTLREQALSEVLTLVGTQAALIDGQFVRYEGLLGVEAAASVEMLTRKATGDEAVFMASEFDKVGAGGVLVAADPEAAPRELPLVQSSRYGMPVSIEVPVGFVARDGDEAVTAVDLARIEPMRRYYKTLLLRSHSEQAANYTPKRAERLLTEIGVPVAWAHIGLENGAYSGFPGHGGYRDSFDPRRTPWYELGKESRAPVWGAPYIDTTGLGIMLPCATALYDEFDNFLGVAAIELTFDYIIEELLEIEAVKNSSESFLLDNEGLIVIRSSKKDKKYSAGITAREIRLPEFDNDAVIAAVKDRQSGYIEAKVDGVWRLIVYQRMNSLGWYYVVMGPEDELL